MRDSQDGSESRSLVPQLVTVGHKKLDARIVLSLAGEVCEAPHGDTGSSVLWAAGTHPLGQADKRWPFQV